MRIAQIAPLFESVPPQLYGGTERVVSFLTEELVSRGHDVTLFASGDSVTAAHMVSPCPKALRLSPTVADPWPHTMILLDQVRRRADDFDILHFHIDLFHFPMFRPKASCTLTTLHGRLDMPDLAPFYRYFSDLPLVSISLSQRLPMPPVRWAGNVYHGLPRDHYAFTPEHRGYLAFLGRICPEKRPDLAIAIARRAGVKLKIAAKVDPADRDYFETEIEPLLDDPLVDFVGEISDAEKGNFLGGAIAVLFPIDWPEPFGLVMIEAMACGTPIIAFDNGSVQEIVEPGVTGAIVRTVDQAVAAIDDVSTLDRHRIRTRFETRFSVERMVDDYLLLYGFAQQQAQPAVTLPQTDATMHETRRAAFLARSSRRASNPYRRVAPGSYPVKPDMSA